MPSITRTIIKKISASGESSEADLLAVEEPLEIRLEYSDGLSRIKKNISVTMRTPGNDAELAIGFLFTEGIIKSHDDFTRVDTEAKNANIVVVALRDGQAPEMGKLDRNFYTTSSCGVCGKASIEAVKVACNIPERFDKIRVPASLICSLPGQLRAHQDVFETTGGLHGCAIFDLDGHLLLAREDVGRHNALDKLVGAALGQGIVPLGNHILLLSGRASFELIQKAVMCGIKIAAAVGAPSSLAVEVAEEWGMTLIGFLRGEKFNIYSGAERIVI
jgi:FdhD protein